MGGEGRTRRIGQWRGPFAWSLLMAISKADLIEYGDVFGPVSWMACEIIHMLETQLTLKFLDYEKLLCNLTSKFLDSQQVLSAL
jgi:neutral trehalase